jgi:IS30 family transposase
MEEVDMNLATALDTMQAMGTASTAATALAREANKAKLQISADIQKQEAQNEQLKAKGEEFVFQTRENREMQKLDRTAGLLDRSTLQEAQYRSDSTSALTGGVQGALSIGAAAYSPAG